MNTRCFIALCIALCFSSNAKGNMDVLTFGNVPNSLPDFEEHTSIPKKAPIKIYGFYPYGMTGTYKSYNYNLLTTVSFYSVKVDAVDQNRLHYNIYGIDETLDNLIQNAKEAGTRVNLTFHCDDAPIINSLLNNKEVRDSFISSITHLLDTTLSDGICVNFFDKLPATNADALISFLLQLKGSLKNSNKSIKITLPANDFSNSYNICKLNGIVDEYILLGSNYYDKGSLEEPVARLDGENGMFHIKKSINEYRKKGIPFEKLTVALPLAGIVWQKFNDRSALQFSHHIYLSQIKQHLAELKHEPKVEFDSATFTYYYDYKKDGDQFMAYYDNAESLEKKINWLKEQGIHSVGIWASGYNDGYEDFWNMVGKNYDIKKLREGDTFVKRLFQNNSISVNAASVDSASLQSINSELFGGFTKATSEIIGNRSVMSTVVITLTVFCVIGIIESLMFSSVRQLVYISSIPSYLIVNGGLILASIVLFIFYGLLKDQTCMCPGFYSIINKLIWYTLFFVWIFINLLSYKMLGSFSLKHDKP